MHTRRHTSFCMVSAVLSQYRSGMCTLYSKFFACSTTSCTLSGAFIDAILSSVALYSYVTKEPADSAG